MKSTAAVSALFIWVNSAAALTGILWSGQFIIDHQMPLFLSLAVVGGLLGGYFGSMKFNNHKLSYVLAFVLAIASIKLILV